MEVLEINNGKLIPVRNYMYDRNKNEVIIKNISERNKDWLRTIIRLDSNFNIKEVERLTEGLVISEKENLLVKTQVSEIMKYFYNSSTIQINHYNSKGNLSVKEFKLYDDKNRIIEKIKLLNIPDDIVVSEIEKYKWIDDYNYNYEKLNFNAPNSKVIGLYKLNEYGDREAFVGNLYLNNSKEKADFIFEKKNRKFDSKGNLIKVYKVDNKEQILIEVRNIIY